MWESKVRGVPSDLPTDASWGPPEARLQASKVIGSWVEVSEHTQSQDPQAPESDESSIDTSHLEDEDHGELLEVMESIALTDLYRSRVEYLEDSFSDDSVGDIA